MKKIILVLCLNIMVPSGPFCLFLEVNKHFHKRRKANFPIIAQTFLCTIAVSPIFIIRKREEKKQITPIWYALIIILMIILSSNRK
ncbi:hypothetical protein [Chitinophaga cymbidii]|uniref:Uncharacterized protein n=1 Tax=Chitinophaga cymbidii TaxID=1096750 RepID=A0A512RQZ4_9BACT|nr:hypothetical protein [Chitinophaga cymbidii]GEP98108.1 hypothetical protein CCY01nite_43680 [Chitinophaga cymbidii]